MQSQYINYHHLLI